MDLKRDYPPYHLVLGLALQYGLRRFWPAATWNVPGLRAAGGALMIAGVVFILGVVLVFRRKRTTIRPFVPPTRLIATGPYRFSRNPIYLAMGVVQLGWGLGLGSLPALAVPPLFAVVVTLRFIRPEERDLTAAFGAAYDDYRKRVPRWL